MGENNDNNDDRNIEEIKIIKIWTQQRQIGEVPNLAKIKRTTIVVDDVFEHKPHIFLTKLLVLRSVSVKL